MLAIKIRKLVAENISISLLPIVSAKKSLDLLSLLLSALPPTYECILSSSEEIISAKINILPLLMSIYLYKLRTCDGLEEEEEEEDCQPAKRLQIRAPPPLGQLQL